MKTAEECRLLIISHLSRAESKHSTSLREPHFTELQIVSVILSRYSFFRIPKLLKSAFKSFKKDLIIHTCLLVWKTTRWAKDSKKDWFFLKLVVLPFPLTVINLWTKLVKWFLVNFGFWLIRSQPDCKERQRLVNFIITFDAAQQVRGFLKVLQQLGLLPFATTQQKNCRIFPAVFI